MPRIVAALSTIIDLPWKDILSALLTFLYSIAHYVGVFMVAAGASESGIVPVPNAEHPNSPERVPEHGGAIAARDTARDLRAPVNTVRREIERAVAGNHGQGSHVGGAT